MRDLYGYTTGPVRNYPEVTTLVVELLNNYSHDASIDVRCFDLDGEQLQLEYESHFTLEKFTSHPFMIPPSQRWEIQIVTDSPTLRIAIFGLDESERLVKYLLFHRDLVPFRVTTPAESKNLPRQYTVSGIARRRNQVLAHTTNDLRF